jgi:transposase
MPDKKTRSAARQRLELVKGFILLYWKTSYTSPTSREIAAHFSTSTSVVSTWLIKLEDEGWIAPRPEKGYARHIIPITVMKILSTIPEP